MRTSVQPEETPDVLPCMCVLHWCGTAHVCRCVDGMAWGWLPEGITRVLPAGEYELRKRHIHGLSEYLLQLSVF